MNNNNKIWFRQINIWNKQISKIQRQSNNRWILVNRMKIYKQQKIYLMK